MIIIVGFDLVRVEGVGTRLGFNIELGVGLLVLLRNDDQLLKI